MRVLVLRPQHDADYTAKLLQMRGHEAIIAPIIEIEPQKFNVQDLPTITAILATSANAFRYLPNDFPIILKQQFCFTVGSHTLEAAKKAGFVNLRTASGDAPSLVKMVSANVPKEAYLLYIAGQPRKPELEDTLQKLGYSLFICEAYKAEAVQSLPEAAIKALLQGVDVILHFSRRSAETAVILFEQAGLTKEAQSAKHICLSDDVSHVLCQYPYVLSAAKPEQSAMLDLIET